MVIAAGVHPYEPYSKRKWCRIIPALPRNRASISKTIGNIVSGAEIMGVDYWAASRIPVATEPAALLAAAE
jgi:hypothetical protein